MVEIFLENPRENHMMEIKRIMTYIKGNEEYGLWYKIGGNLDFKVFKDVDQIGIIDDRNSTNGGEFFLTKDQCLGQVRNKIVSLDP